MLLFGIFLHYLGLLGLLRCYANSLLSQFTHFFWVKLFVLKPCSCKKNPMSGKIFAKFTLCCRESEQCRNFALFVAFFGTFGNFMLLFGIFCTILVF